MKVAAHRGERRRETVLTGPGPGGLTNDYVTKAIELLKADGVDVVGAGYQPVDVTLPAQRRLTAPRSA